MIKRTLEISRESVHLAVQHDQLKLVRHEPESGILASVPCEDIGLLLVDHPETTYSQAALARLLEFGAAVVVCGRNHLPAGLLLPLSGHTEVVHRLREQIEAGLPLRKRLWRQIVVAKVRAQARQLDEVCPGRRKLLALAREVKSGDPTNIEAQAAKIYWAHWLESPSLALRANEAAPFHRDPDGTDPINVLLHYGYAVLRAAVARALVGAGLHPALGLHHANRSNAFCLADDLMEPLRPMVDGRVRELHRQGKEQLERSTKAVLLELLTAEVRVGDTAGPLMVGLHRTAASLVRCYQGEEDRLLLPVF